MRQYLAVLFLLAASVHLSHQQCNATNCIGPACRCASTSPPGGLNANSVPQMVFLSFDGAITTTTINSYITVLKDKTNPNGCPISATFFVNHEYNDYNLTRNLYYGGSNYGPQEIATSTMTHLTPAEQYANKTKDQWLEEIGNIRTAISTFANIPVSAIKTARSPYLQSSGDTTMQAMVQLGMMFDSSFPTTQYRDPPLWPYTLDQGFQHECAVPPCPSGKYPGLWTIPMVTMKDVNNTVCSMADGCDSGPQANIGPTTRQDTYTYLRNNFAKHAVNSAPFGVYLQANKWFSTSPDLLAGYLDFINYLASLDNVYIVSMSKGLEWMKNPTSLSGSASLTGPFGCSSVGNKPTCNPRNCYYDENSSAIGSRIMMSCITCPDFYPWLGNPTGTLAP